MLIAKAPEKEFADFPLPEAGTVQAVCCGVWDIGLQKFSYNGEEKILHKVVIAWELNQLIESPDSEYNGKPYMLTKTYTVSLAEKANLRHDLESWRGKPFTAEEIANGFDLEKLYGVNCLLGVSHVESKKEAGKFFANISALLPLAKGMEHIKPVREQNAQPPKWVLERAANAVSADENPF